MAALAVAGSALLPCQLLLHLQQQLLALQYLLQLLGSTTLSCLLLQVAMR
jgi:hypothetical protein